MSSHLWRIPHKRQETTKLFKILICLDTNIKQNIQASNTNFRRNSQSDIIIIIYPLTTMVVWVPQMISQPVSSISPVLHCPLGLGDLPACPFPDVVFPPLPLSASSSSPFTVPCEMVLVRPDERETWPYHCSFRLFMSVMRSSCGPIACWIFARTC